VKRAARLLIIVSLAAAAASLVACSSTQAQTAPAEQPAAQQATQPALDVFDLIEQMRPEEKREKLAPGFPVEVPVPVGTVGSTKAQGPDAWDYALQIDHDPSTVQSWYVRAYEQRGWEVVNAGMLSQGMRGYYLEMRKNSAESRVDIIGDPGAPYTIVKVVVGVGTPVLETF
jgi:hypothetical protein